MQQDNTDSKAQYLFFLPLKILNTEARRILTLDSRDQRNTL